jgi:signal transduction histidine kinase
MNKPTTWLAWLMPRPWDYVSTLLTIGVVAVHFYLHFANICPQCDHFTLPYLALLIGGALLLLTLDRVEYWRYGETPPKRLAAYFFILRTILIVAISIADSFNLSLFLYLFIPFTSFPVFGAGVSYGLAVLAWLFYLVKIRPVEPLWYDNVHQVIFFSVYTLGLVFIVAMAHVVRREQRSRTNAEKLFHDLDVSHRQLQTYALRIAELAATEERNRLARDIHDSLGHYLTVINVQLEKALAFRERQPAIAEQALKDAKRLAGEALQDIRRSVGALRNAPENFSLVQNLYELVNNVTNSQLQIELMIDGDEQGFSRQALVTLYRAAQEGLTNVQKHAAATHATLQITLGDQAGNLRLCDNGQGFDPTQLVNGHAAAERGYGLQGLRERLELIGGTLRVESAPNQGTTVWVAAPKQPLTLVQP